MIDKLVLTAMIITGIFTTHMVAFEYGKKNQCEKSEKHLYSIDFGRCFEISEARNVVGR